MSDVRWAAKLTAIATISAAVIGFFAGRGSTTVNVHLPGTPSQSISPDQAGETIRDLTQKNIAAEARALDLQSKLEKASLDLKTCTSRKKQPTVEPKPPESPVSDPNNGADSPLPKKNIRHSETKGGTQIEILKCHLESSRVHCDGQLTMTKGGYNHIVGGVDGTFIWDMDGNQYPLTRVKLGAKEGWRVDGDFPSGVPTRFEVIFEGVPDNLQQISALQIAAYQNKFVFKKIALVW